MKKAKVHVYIKPLQEKGSNPLGIIKTDQTGRIIPVEEEKKQLKTQDLDIEQVILKTFEKEQKQKDSSKNTANKESEVPLEDKEKKELQNFQDYSHFLYFKYIEQTEKKAFIKPDITVEYPFLNQLIQKPQKEIMRDPNLEINNPLAVLEAALFMAVEGLDTNSLSKLIKKNSSQTKELLNELKKRYSQQDSALELSAEPNDRWVLRIKQQYAPAVRQFAKEVEISQHALKTLAFIAKNENITKRELFKKLGSQIYADVEELEKKGFIKTIPQGRTSKIKLTPKFNEYFGI
jgi:Predicted transcriptional regulator containing the HTH domain